MTITTDKSSRTRTNAVLKPETVYDVQVPVPGRIVLTEMAAVIPAKPKPTKAEVLAAIRHTRIRLIRGWDALRQETRE